MLFFFKMIPVINEQAVLKERFPNLNFQPFPENIKPNVATVNQPIEKKTSSEKDSDKRYFGAFSNKRKLFNIRNLFLPLDLQ